MNYENLILDEERALYGIQDASVKGCMFDGPEDGESALKESKNVRIDDCDFRLRYPLWHVTGAGIRNCRLHDTCRAALWYDQNITIEDSELKGIKALRECKNIELIKCGIQSAEFGWRCSQVKIRDSEVVSEYPFFETRDMQIDNLNLTGKYSFQYVENVLIQNSNLNTKDAFWHSTDVTVVDSVIKGEYLAWYSQGLKLIRCKIIGTQPFCYAKGLVLEDCEMIDTDLAFENSEVHATVKGTILSVKNPWSGRIEADDIGEVILDDYQNKEDQCHIISRSHENNMIQGRRSETE